MLPLPRPSFSPTWRQTPDYNSSGFGPYLPDTYFPYTKRSIIHRPSPIPPESPIAPLSQPKRPRRGSSPQAHRELAAMKFAERRVQERSASLSSSISRNGSLLVCQKHQSLIPVPILTYMQRQGTILNRNQATMDALTDQVTALSNTVYDSLSRPSQQQVLQSHQNDQLTMTQRDYQALQAYHGVVSKMLSNLNRNYQPKKLLHTTANFNYSSSGLTPAWLRETLNSMNRIRQLLISHYQFDCQQSRQEQQRLANNATFTLPPFEETLGNSSMNLSRMRNTLEDMESNLRSFISNVEPRYTSTPRPKRKEITSDHPDAQDQLRLPPQRRTLAPRRVTFTFPPSDEMEVDAQF